MSTIAAIGLLASLIGQGYSMYQSAEERKKADKMLKGRVGAIEGALDTATARSVFDTEDAQQALERLRGGLQQITRQQDRDAIRTGQTHEGQLAAADVAGQRYAAGLSDIAVLGDRRKQMDKWRYENMLQRLHGQQLQRQDLQAAQQAQMGESWGQFGGIMTDLAALYAQPGSGAGASQLDPIDPETWAGLYSGYA